MYQQKITLLKYSVVYIIHFEGYILLLPQLNIPSTKAYYNIDSSEIPEQTALQSCSGLGHAILQQNFHCNTLHPLLLKCEFHYFMNYLVIDYSNENEPVKYIIMGHSTVPLVIPYNESAAVKTQNDRTFSTSATYFIE